MPSNFAKVIQLTLLIIALCFASLTARANQLPNHIDVSIGVLNTLQSSSPRVNAVFTYTNTSAQPVSLLKWGTALEGRLNEDVLSIVFEGKTLKYSGRIYKRGEPKASDYISIAPHSSVSATVDLRESYPIAKKGNYQLGMRFEALSKDQRKTSLTTNTNLILAQDLPLFKQPPTFSGSCSSSRQTLISSALDAAEVIAKTARDDLMATPVADRPNALRYKEWFGAYSLSRWNTVQNNFNEIYDSTASEVINFDCSCTEGFFAYVIPSQDYDIYLCNVFWSAPLTGTDSKAGTIIHELSHFTVVAGTSDHEYGQTKARTLAIDDPDRAINNADSIEYFAENTPFISMPDPAPPVDPPVDPPAAVEDDFLLSIVPLLAAVSSGSTNPVPPVITPVETPLDQVKKLGGRWKSTRTSSGIDFEDYYRFNTATALSVSGGAGISGEAHLNGSFSFYTSEATGIYSSEEKSWAVLEPWGPPTSDLGSLYIFTSIGSTINASHFYYKPSNFELSTGIATPTVITKLSSNYKSDATRSSTREEQVARLLADHNQEKISANFNTNKNLSEKAEVARRVLEIVKSSNDDQ